MALDGTPQPLQPDEHATHACVQPLGRCTFARPSSKITRMSSPGFQWPVRGLVRAALLDDSGQTDAYCALLVIPTRGPERLEG